MFAYFATRKFTFPLEWFLRDWAPQPTNQVQVVPYEGLFDFRSLRGTAILSDWDRLHPDERTTYSRWFAERGQGRFLNPPGGAPERETLNATAGSCINTHVVETTRETGHGFLCVKDKGDATGRYPLNTKSLRKP